MMDICFELDAIYPFIDVFANAARHDFCLEQNQRTKCGPKRANYMDLICNLPRAGADLYCPINQPQDSPAPKYNQYARDSFGRYPEHRDW
jgi:hypothetical protein